MIDAIRQRHDLPHGLAELARLVMLGHRRSDAARLAGEQLRIPALCQGATEVPGNKTGRAACNVDVLAHEVAVDPRDEIVGIEIEVLDVGIELGGEVVPQPLRIHADLQVAQRADARAARLGHLLARNRDEAVRVHVVGHLVGRAGEFQHRRPEQRMEVDDVLADEMDLLGIGRRQELLEGAGLARARALPLVK